MEATCGGSSMSENKNAKTPADGQQWITTTWIKCQDEVWRQLPTPKKVSKDDVTPPKREWVSEALWLADVLDHEFTQGRISNHNGRKAAVELRRLHEVNQDLLKALHEALETEQEPVAWMHNFIEGNVITHIPADIGRHPERWTPLYSAPPKKQWVGLTDDDVIYFRYQATFCDEFDAAFMAELIEKDLKEKNHG